MTTKNPTTTLLAILVPITVLMFSSYAQALKSKSKSNPERIVNLIHSMPNSELKEQLLACKNKPLSPHPFSIGHRGAPLFLPEHTQQSYEAGFRMGAATLECDVTFTKDKQLVCRHSQCDLHTTTNILQTPLAKSCRQPFSAATELNDANAQCCTTDITLDEFLSLQGRMDKVNRRAKSISEYLIESPQGKVLSHQQSIELFKNLGVMMTPELKQAIHKPAWFSQSAYAKQMIEEYLKANVPLSDIWPQSFHLEDVQFWLQEYPQIRQQIIYLDGRYEQTNFDHNDPTTWSPSMTSLKEMGLSIIAPPIWMLLSQEQTPKGIKIVPSEYAKQAKAAGLSILTWSLERSGPLSKGGGWYYQSINPALKYDGQVFDILEVLAKDIGVKAVFSDWPATTTYYANCRLD